MHSKIQNISKAEVKNKKSKPFIFSFKGDQNGYLTKEEDDFFKSHPVSGFILFSHNIKSSKQLKSLTSYLKDIYKDNPDPEIRHQSPLILIDQEGGRVQRLKPQVGQALYPNMQYFSDIYKAEGKDKAVKAVTENYTKLMQELKNFGIDSPLAPVADLSSKLTSSVIGDRSFGDNIEVVVELTLAAIKGIINSGGLPVIKHIPGHGKGRVDSHLELPLVSDKFDELNASDFEVFRRVIAKAKESNLEIAAMTAHIVFNCLDENNPSTVSAKVIEFIKAKEGFDFNGSIFTDAIDMLALHAPLVEKLKLAGKIKSDSSYKDILDIICPLDEFKQSLIDAANKAHQAGCDYIIYCYGELAHMHAIYDAFSSDRS